MTKTAEDLNKSGNAWLDKGDFDKAIEDFDKVIELNPKYKEASDNRDRVLKKKEGG